jgi:YidC/Oxa1 family membrane protein insertase
MSYFYHTFFFDPLFNTLISLFNIFPWADAGVIIVFLTVLVRLVTYPLSKKAVMTQMKMAEIAPELAKIKEEHKGKSEEQARATLALYKERGVNPFSGILVMIIQIPVVFTLYQIFVHFPEINTNLLYSFVPSPGQINTVFLGLFDIAMKSAPLAILAAISTFFQFKISTQGQTPPKGDSFGDNLARSMQTQMKYFFPIIVFFISYTISGAVALYWLTTNVFTIIQETFLRKKKPSAQ